jgi:hypothetical protein
LNARAAVKVSTALYRLEQGNFSNTKGVGGGIKISMPQKYTGRIIKPENAKVSEVLQWF